MLLLLIFITKMCKAFYTSFRFYIINPTVLIVLIASYNVQNILI